MGTLLEDLRHSIRQLVNRPGLTLTALVSLVLGIGATTAVFSVIYAALINPYPFVGADRIVRLTIQSKRSEEHTSELQSHSDLVCRLLLEKKKRNTNIIKLR